MNNDDITHPAYDEEAALYKRHRKTHTHNDKHKKQDTQTEDIIMRRRRRRGRRDTEGGEGYEDVGRRRILEKRLHSFKHGNKTDDAY